MTHETPNPTEFTERITRLWTKAQPSVLAFLLSAVRNPAAADDLLQEVALTVVRRFDRFEPGTDFLAWAITIARFKTMDYQKAAGRDRHVFGESVLDRLGSAAAQVADELTSRRLALETCIEQLPEDQRRVLAMRYEQNLPVNQIADATNAKPNTIAVSLRRIRLSLRTCIERKMESERS